MLQRIRPQMTMRTLTIFSLLFIGWVGAFMALIQPTQASPAGVSVPVSPAGKIASAPAIAVTRQGSVHIVWQQDGGLWYRNWRNGVWSAIEQVAVEGESPTLATDPYGEIVYLAWEQEFGGNYEIFARKWDSVNGWSAPHNVSSNDGGSSAATLAVSPTGQIHLIWADTTPGTSTLYHAISTDGESWPVALPITNAKGSNPAAAFDAAGALHVAWQYRASFAENLRIWTARYANNAWSAPVAITDGSQQAFSPDMAGHGGRIALVWQEGTQVKLALLGNSGWVVNNTQTGSAPAVAINSHGVIEWAWVTNTGLARQFGLSGWTTPTTWSLAGSNALDLATKNTSIGIVWIQNDNGSDRVFYNSENLATMYQPLIMTR